MTDSSQAETKKPDNHIGLAIRRFRKQCGQTQAQFANALGLAPTSIYRYESGNGSPELDVLKKLRDYAQRRDVSWAANRFLSHMLGMLDPATATEGEFALVGNELRSVYPEPPIHRVEIEGERLTSQEQLTVIATVLMLRHSQDASNQKLLNVLLERWLPAAISEFQAKHRDAIQVAIESSPANLELPHK